MLVEAARLLLFPSLMAFAASSDLLTLTISNRISLALALGFLILAALCGLTPQAILWHMLAGLTVLSAGLALFARGLVGGGDAKLAAVAALWLGSDRLADYALLSSLLGGAVTLAILRFSPDAAARLARGRHLGGEASSARWRRSLWHRPRRGRTGDLSLNELDGLLS